MDGMDGMERIITWVGRIIFPIWIIMMAALTVVYVAAITGRIPLPGPRILMWVGIIDGALCVVIGLYLSAFAWRKKIEG
jgi:hypothetical protein